MKKYIICAYNIDEEIEQNLINLDITPVKLCGIQKFRKRHPSHPISYHPDMFCFHLNKNKWIFYDEVYRTNQNIIDRLNLEIITAENPASCEYPNDVGLNAAITGNNLICNVRHTNRIIIDHTIQTKKNINIIDVKQGYAKCSACIVDEHAIITSDVSIYEKAKQNQIDALPVEKGHIDLDGYDYGFIGGCSGLININGKNKLLFTGNIKLHPDYEKIKRFCDNRGVEIISLSEKKLKDYGSLFVV